MQTIPDAARPKLEVRDLRFTTAGGDIPRHWHGGRRAVTAFFDNLSIFFPAGEAFFVDAVKAHRDRVEDPDLRREVARFCAQEGTHAREHMHYNDMLESQGYPAARLERRVERILDRVQRKLPARTRLAATAALEHFTAVLAHGALEEPRMFLRVHPTMRALWRWHAVEEIEHRAVAFDVYRAAGGGYAERCGAMLLATAIFWPLVAVHQVEMMRAQGAAASVEEWGDLLYFLFGDPGTLRKMVRPWLDYFRPGFHPLEVPSDALIDAWVAEAARATDEASRAAATPGAARAPADDATRAGGRGRASGRLRPSRASG